MKGDSTKNWKIFLQGKFYSMEDTITTQLLGINLWFLSKMFTPYIKVAWKCHRYMIATFFDPFYQSSNKGS